MITIGKLRYLHIDKKRFSFIGSVEGSIDYQKWVKYIDDKSDIFIWYENTKSGQEILKKIDTIPDDIRNTFTSLLNRVRCFAKFNVKKDGYDISVGCCKVSKQVTITFERSPKIEELRLFLDMAKHLDALLLYRGKKIIDDKLIDELEKQQIEKKKKHKP